MNTLISYLFAILFLVAAFWAIAANTPTTTVYFFLIMAAIQNVLGNVSYLEDKVTKLSEQRRP